MAWPVVMQKKTNNKTLNLRHKMQTSQNKVLSIQQALWQTLRPKKSPWPYRRCLLTFYWHSEVIVQKFWEKQNFSTPCHSSRSCEKSFETFFISYLYQSLSMISVILTTCPVTRSISSSSMACMECTTCANFSTFVFPVDFTNGLESSCQQKEVGKIPTRPSEDRPLVQESSTFPSPANSE